MVEERAVSVPPSHVPSDAPATEQDTRDKEEERSYTQGATLIVGCALQYKDRDASPAPVCRCSLVITRAAIHAPPCSRCGG